MSIRAEEKQKLIAEYRIHERDTGSVETQIAVLTKRIQNLTEHLKEHTKDFNTRRGLLILVGRRNSLLRYMKKKKYPQYRQLIERLGLRK
jgi:small subunit ribosomal protein S15